MTSTIPLSPRAVSGFGGAAVTPHHLATVAALVVLERGGNAVDAAVAANAVQGVVAPETCGIGGDLFALVSVPDGGDPLALNSSGRAGSGVDPETLRREGLTEIPQHHPAAVTVPGCVDGWFALQGRLGNLDLASTLQPAIRLARGGFPASTELAAAFGHRLDELTAEPGAADMYPGGRAPQSGEHIVRPGLAATLQRIADEGREAFYGGPVGDAIVAALDRTITPQDLARDQAEWVDPISVDVFGRTCWTVPPNAQGYVALLAMAILEEVGLGEVDDPAAWHAAIEASRLAVSDRHDVLADPEAMTSDPADLVSDRRIAELAARFDPASRGSFHSTTRASGGTAFLCVVDATGMGVSLIQSNYAGIGSGISVAEGGFLLHDRGRGFVLSPGHPNELAPGRRPLHTLSPTLWTSEGRLESVLGTRGGHIQPQLVAQLGTAVFGHGLSPAEAMAFPRWSFDPGVDDGPIEIEPGVPAAVVAGLGERGHSVEQASGPHWGWGPMSVITVDESGLRRGAADPRVDTTSAEAW
jgi:gamma-glutamyltranspeptidase / glutathione hydrolase